MYLYDMPLTLYRIRFLLLLAFMQSGLLSAQPLSPADRSLDSLSMYIQTKYGLNQELFNGYQYYKRFVQYKGDPFFPDDTFYEGSVTIRGVPYNHVGLKYNTYTQDLILEYTDFQGRYNQLRLNNIHIDSFRLENYCFQKLHLFGEDPLFYQVVSSGPVTCYIHWTKNIHSTSDDLQYSHEYTGVLGTYYLSCRGEITTFSNRKTFISIFPELMQREIKRYLKHQSLSFREAGSADIQNLVNYISLLMETPSEH